MIHRAIHQLATTLKRTVLVLLALLVTAPAVVRAAPIPATDMDAIVNDTVNYKYDYTQVAAGCATVSAATGAVQSGGGNAYIIGDSIMNRVSATLNTTLTGKGWTTKINALDSRSLAGAVPAPNGIDAIEQDQAFIATAKVIVVELGTNSNGLDVANIGKFIDRLHVLSPTAIIYWVDTAVVSRADVALVLNNVNSTIYSQAAVKNYQVLSWNKAVFGSGADPSNMAGGVDSAGFIDLTDGLNVHPTAAGISGMNGIINAALGSSVVTGGGNGVGGTCGCTATLAGSDNEQKVWFFLLGKGLTPTQAAGFLGNMIAEAHFEPRLVEYGYNNSQGIVSVQGTPSSLDDNAPPDQPNLQTGKQLGQPGYGIIQWGGSRKAALHGLAQQKGTIDGNLGTQLDYLWSELTSQFFSQVLADVKATNTVAAATEIITRRFEIPGGNILDQISARTGFANDALLAMQGLTSPGAGGGCGSAPGSSTIDMAHIFDDSTGITCDPRTTDVGNWDGYHDGVLVPIKLCRLPTLKSDGRESASNGGALTYPYSIPNANGFAIVNSRVSGAYQNLVEAGTAAGAFQFGISSSYRSMENQLRLCAADPGCTAGDFTLTAKPGTSNHQMGLAIDFYWAPGINSHNNCVPQVTFGTRCTLLGNANWAWMEANAANFGFKPYINEFWHWSPTGN